MTTQADEVRAYFRKLADESIYWHITTDTDLSWKAQEALEALAMYEEGHICEECGDMDSAIEESQCYNCSDEGKQERARDEASERQEQEREARD